MTTGIGSNCMNEGQHSAGALLVVDTDRVLLDYLSQIFVTREFDVVTATTLRAGLDELQQREIDAVIAGWETAGGANATLYQRVMQRRPELRNQFVFLAESVPDELHGVIEGRAAVVDPWDIEELIRVVEEAVRRFREQRSARMSARDMAVIEQERPTMLLVEDGPLELMAMNRVLTDFGFEVTPVDCGNAAIAQLRERHFHVVLSDWYMDDGSGADLFQWLSLHRPDMAERIVFMSGASTPADFDELAPGRPLIPKGQDAPQLLRALMRIARKP